MTERCQSPEEAWEALGERLRQENKANPRQHDRANYIGALQGLACAGGRPLPFRWALELSQGTAPDVTDPDLRPLAHDLVAPALQAALDRGVPRELVIAAAIETAAIRLTYEFLAQAERERLRDWLIGRDVSPEWLAEIDAQQREVHAQRGGAS